MGFCNCSRFCCALLCVHSSFAIISMLACCFALFVFLASRDCCVALPHDAMGLSALCVIVVFPDHTHYFCSRNKRTLKISLAYGAET